MNPDGVRGVTPGSDGGRGAEKYILFPLANVTKARAHMNNRQKAWL